MKSGRELDAEVAERVMGWPVVMQPDNPNGNDEWFYALTFPCLIVHTAGGYQLQRSSNVCDMEDFRPSESIEAAMQVEDRIAELGLQNDYIAALWDVIGSDRSVNFWTASNTRAFWLCVHATAEQRCRAALAAIE